MLQMQLLLLLASSVHPFSIHLQPVPKPMRCSMEEAYTKMQEANKHYLSLKGRAAVLREHFLAERKEDPTLSEAQRKRAKQQLATERQRKVSRDIRRVDQKVKGQALKEVEVSHPDGSTTKLSDQTEVETAIAEMVTERYQLCNTTPLMQEPWLSRFGAMGETQTSAQLLQGDHSSLHDMEEYTRLLLSQITPQGPSPPIPASMEVTDFVQYWKQARERTSSSVSNRHFGHYIASTKSEELAEIHATVCHVARSTGYALKRWERALLVMIQKKPGVLDVQEQRAINLMEADFNYTNKNNFGSSMIKRALKDKLLPQDCFGGIPGRSGQTLAFTRRCVMDLSRLLLIPLAIASVDAGQCYDRIQHTVASLCCQAWGVPLPHIISMFSAIQRMQFSLRTAFGDSDDTFNSEGLPHPFQGVLQGNGGGPAVWLAISAFLLKALYAQGCFSTISTPISAALSMLVGFLFVDDTDLIIWSNPGESAQDVIQRLQTTINTWQGTLRASGGELKPIKCTWSLLDFQWRGGVVKPRPDSHSPAIITVSDHSGNQVPISRIATDEAEEAVGAYSCLNGSMQPQI